MMRATVRRCVSQGAPIPVLIASAAVKVPVGDARVDLAEVAGLKVLASLHERVAAVYRPSLHFRVRLEDQTERVLSSDTPNLEPAITRYVQDFRDLIDVLEVPVEAVTETDLLGANADRFLTEASRLQPIFVAHLADNTAAEEEWPALETYRRLTEEGWAGGIPSATRSFFEARFRRNYPDMPPTEHNGMIARYLSAVLARRKLKASGQDPNWLGRLEISFAPPLPDSPVVSPRVYYRTVPRTESEQHLAWWCARGLMKIGEHSSRIALTNWWDTQTERTKGHILLSNGTKSVTLQTAYTLV